MKKAKRVERRESRVESQKAHTPGPWENNKWNCEEHQISAKGGTIALVSHSHSLISEAEADANARVIAAAAELLAAVKACLPMVEYFNEREGCPQTLRTVHAAITKAEGAEGSRQDAKTQGDGIMVRMDHRELATVLAALRHFQGAFSPTKCAKDGFEHFEEVDPLTADDIDELCERLNMGGE